MDSQNDPNDTGFYFVKPAGIPIFVCCIGTQYFMTPGSVLTRPTKRTDRQAYYRTACASVMQEDTLISGSLLDNIAFMDKGW